MMKNAACRMPQPKGTVRMFRTLKRSASCFGFALAAIGLVAMMAPPATAQGLGWSGGAGSVGFGSRPFDFRAPSATGSAGMSLAYRQAILEAAIDNRRRSNLVRGPDGLLVDVERRDGQAFVRAQAAPLLPRHAFERGTTGIAIGGIGIGIGARSITAWIGQVRTGIVDDYTHTVVGYHPASSHAIDEWIALL